MIRPLTRVLLVLLALLALPLSAYSFEPGVINSIEREVEGYKSDLQRIAEVIAQPEVTEEQLSEQRRLLENIRVEAASDAGKLAGPLAEVTQQLKQLGTPPTDGTAEAPAIADQRTQLTALLARVTAAQKQLELVALEAEQNAAKISALQRDQFFQRIFSPSRSIMDPRLWVDTASGFVLLAERIGTLISNWWTTQGEGVNWLGFVLPFLAVGVLWAALRLFRTYVWNRFTGGLKETTDPSTLRRLWRAVWGTVASVAGVMLLVAMVALSLQFSNLLTQRLDILFNAVGNLAVDAVGNTALAWFLCAPRKPQWRLINVDDASARRLPLLVLAATIVHSALTELGAVSEALYLPVSLSVGQSAIAALLLITLIVLTLTLLRREAKAAHDFGGRPFFLADFVNFIPLIGGLLLVASGALLLGYIALAYFIVGQVLDTSFMLVFLVLLHHLADAAAHSLRDPRSSLGRIIRRVSSMTEKGISRTALILRTVADVVLVVVGIPILFAQWTVTWVDFRSILNTAALGFRIGNIVISPTVVAVTLLTLAVGVLVTRLLTRWLDRRVLSEIRLNKGVRDSIHMGANYAGYVLAIALALSVAGIDFSNIAIIAGALGLGIGFGLQSIVNNFVSGLILLAERPVRVGDWVVTTAGEGIVRKINVRSTEIETFDNCSIIVPNANLITEPVRNWMHRDNSGRFLVQVTAAYGSDAEKISKLLMEITEAHPKVMSKPAPLVQLRGFGPHGLEFDVRGHVADIFDGAAVASDIRFAIAREFGKRKIVIPSVVPPKPASR
jgi:small-conductance mechanosensitive channel